jgi:hypothetical protein
MRFRGCTDEEIERRVYLEENFKMLSAGKANFIVDAAENSKDDEGIIFSIILSLIVFDNFGGIGKCSYSLCVDTGKGHKKLKEFLKSIGKEDMYDFPSDDEEYCFVEIPPCHLVGGRGECVISIEETAPKIPGYTLYPYFSIDRFGV